MVAYLLVPIFLTLAQHGYIEYDETVAPIQYHY
jgi:hypothetical protein